MILSDIDLDSKFDVSNLLLKFGIPPESVGEILDNIEYLNEDSDEDMMCD